ncbi:uncharacterized protein VNE69_05257 [Vairimorpha necatrix]|uniref:Uncharacterized protein n=1 Tax=Vairimorpha necatrix TaxID=6039 RepID=A0AAX4JCS6_9MICR
MDLLELENILSHLEEDPTSTSEIRSSIENVASVVFSNATQEANFTETNKSCSDGPSNIKALNTIKYYENSLSPKVFMNCRKKISEIKKQQNLMIDAIKYSCKTTKNNIQDNFIILAYNKKIYKFFEYIRNLHRVQFPKIYDQLKTFEVPPGIYSLILEFLDIFKDFNIIFETKVNYGNLKKYSINTKNQITSYNIKIMSIFKFIPIFEAFKYIESEAISFPNNNIEYYRNIRKVLYLIKRKLDIVYKRSCKCIHFYNKINQVLNKNFYE